MKRKEIFTTENTEGTEVNSVNSVRSVVNTNDLPAGFQMTELGPLPEEWRVVRLREVVETTSGGTPSRNVPEFFGGTIPWVKSGELNDALVSKTEETITEEGLKNSNAKIFQQGTLLIAMYGATAGKVGILAIPATTNQAICAILPNPSLALENFLFFALIRQRETLLSQRYGGAQPNLNQTIIRSLLIPLPPLPEQRAIAHVLRTVQRAREATDGVSAALKELKKSLMRHLFTYGPVPVGAQRAVSLQETELGPIPAHWRVVRLGEVFDILQGKSLSAKQNKGIRPRPFLRTSNVYWGFLDLSRLDVMDFTEEEEQKFTLQHGDLLVCEGGDVGRTAMWEGQMQGVYYQNHLHRLRARDNNVNPAFVMYWLQTAFTLLNLYSGSSNKTTIPNLSQGRLAVFPIPLPPLDEQRDIARMLQAVDARIAAEEARRAALEEVFKTLLHELMSGKRRVRFTTEHTEETEQ